MTHRSTEDDCSTSGIRLLLRQCVANQHHSLPTKLNELLLASQNPRCSRRDTIYVHSPRRIILVLNSSRCEVKAVLRRAAVFVSFSKT